MKKYQVVEAKIKSLQNKKVTNLLDDHDRSLQIAALKDQLIILMKEYIENNK